MSLIVCEKSSGPLFTLSSFLNLGLRSLNDGLRFLKLGSGYGRFEDLFGLTVFLWMNMSGGGWYRNESSYVQPESELTEYR